LKFFFETMPPEEGSAAQFFILWKTGNSTVWIPDESVSYIYMVIGPWSWWSNNDPAKPPRVGDPPIYICVRKVA
jgi:hypothetical protein